VHLTFEEKLILIPSFFKKTEETQWDIWVLSSLHDINFNIMAI